MPGNATKNKKVQVYETLKQRIIDMELAPGLPINEAVFAEDLGVSKTPIREALRQLERDGFVINVPGRGSTIAHITQQEIKDVFQIRELLESGVAAKAASFQGNEELRAIRDELQELLDSGKEVDSIVFEWGSHENIHTAIVQSLENESLITIYMSLMDRIRRIRNYFGKKFTQRRFHDILTEHVELLDAILSGNERKAAQMMVSHLTNASSFVLGL